MVKFWGNFLFIFFDLIHILIKNYFICHFIGKFILIILTLEFNITDNKWEVNNVICCFIFNLMFDLYLDTLKLWIEKKFLTNRNRLFWNVKNNMNSTSAEFLFLPSDGILIALQTFLCFLLLIVLILVFIFHKANEIKHRGLLPVFGVIAVFLFIMRNLIANLTWLKTSNQRSFTYK